MKTAVETAERVIGTGETHRTSAAFATRVAHIIGESSDRRSSRRIACPAWDEVGCSSGDDEKCGSIPAIYSRCYWRRLTESGFVRGVATSDGQDW